MTAKIAVLFNPVAGTQRFYTQHLLEIVSLTVGNTDACLIATGEMGREPSIHVWNSHSLQTLRVLKGVHRKGVHLMCFSSDDRCLVTGGLASSNAVVVYQWRSGEVVLSLSSPALLQDVFSMPDLNNPAQTGFLSESSVDFHETVTVKKAILPQLLVVLSLAELIILHLGPKTSIDYVPLSSSDVSSPAVCALAIVADSKNPFQNSDLKTHLVLTGHDDGSVLIFSAKQFVGTLTCYRKDSVTCMSKCYKGIAIATKKGFVYIWDNLLMNQLTVLQMN